MRVLEKWEVFYFKSEVHSFVLSTEEFMRNIWVTRYLGPNMVSNLPSSEKVKILLFVHAFPKDNFKKDIFKSEVLYNLSTFFVKTSINQLIFILFKIQDLPPTHTWKVDLFGAMIWKIKRDKEFHSKPNFGAKYLISLI